MGAALGWLIQIHMSWPLLLPFTAGAWLSARHDGARSLLVNARRARARATLATRRVAHPDVDSIRVGSW